MPVRKLLTLMNVPKQKAVLPESGRNNNSKTTKTNP